MSYTPIEPPRNGSAASSSSDAHSPSSPAASSSVATGSRLAEACKMYNFETFLRTKSTEQVLYEAAEEERAVGGGGSAADENSTAGAGGGLKKALTVWDVIAYGVSSTIGSGIFAITGTAATTAGPAVVLSFIVAAVACLFSAFSYMEFAARVPIAGSAYTFTYVCLGELPAWFVGWNLTLEYAISAAVGARAWADSFVAFFSRIHATPPSWLNDVELNNGVIDSLSILAAFICLVCMVILLVGVKESSTFNMFITVLNISIILFIIGYGAQYVDTGLWTAPVNTNCSAATFVNATLTYTEPLRSATSSTGGSYFPTGTNGIITGAAMVFFSYIGFDSVTTLAEEVKNPKRDVPIGIISTLLVSTGLYIGTAMVVTGMTAWVCMSDTPFIDAFSLHNQDWAATLIAGCTVTALTGTTLTSLFGQPRVFYRMAKDGLFFAPFAYIHPKTKAPVWGTVYSGLAASIIAFLIPLESLSNMISIGTLLAFSTVCAGVVILRYQRIIDPVSQGGVSAGGDSDQQRLLAVNVAKERRDSQSDAPYNAMDTDAQGVNLGYIPSQPSDGRSSSPQPSSLPARIWKLVKHLNGSATVWTFIFVIPSILTCAALRHTASLPIYVPIIGGLICFIPAIVIWRMPVAVCNLPKPGNFTCPLVPWLPLMGIWTNIYLITSLDLMSYVRVAVWTVIGFAIYFGYGIMHSTLVESTRAYRMAMDAQKEREEESANTLTTNSSGGRQSPQLIEEPLI